MSSILIDVTIKENGTCYTNSIIRELLAEERQEVLYFLQAESPCGICAWAVG